MCGIAGFYSQKLSSYDDSIKRMCLSISHRGPDSFGSWYDQNSGISLGHQRLSILDLSKNGNQPMLSSTGRYVLTYNGEIYNHLNLRREIESQKKDIIWRGTSDTETLLESIEHWGFEETLKKIEGMFAIGLWDKKLRNLILSRDRLGEKPLYYGFQGKGKNKVFLFGSELKALKAHPEFYSEINRDAIALQFSYNCIPSPYSIYKNIYKLKPGHYLTINESDIHNHTLPLSKNYWSFEKIAHYGAANQFAKRKENIQENFEDILKSTVKNQMMTDVPLGAFLSGGIDSSTIVALMQLQSNNPIKTFTIGFAEESYNEAIFAKKISSYLGTDHTELYVSPKEVFQVIPKLSHIYDEPFSDSSQIPTFLVSQLAKKDIKVALSGDAGDELFCGYNRYIYSKKIQSIIQFLPFFLRRTISLSLRSLEPEKLDKLSKIIPIINKQKNIYDKINKFAKAIESTSISEIHNKLCSHWSNPYEVVLGGNESNITINNFSHNLKSKNLDIQQQMMIMDSLSYLPDDILVKVDRAAMASSLETRIPFLNHKLIEHVWKIPHSLKFKNGQGKWILRQTLKKYVPEKIFKRPKMGFAIPLDTWLRGPLKDWAEDLLDEKKLNQDGYLNSKVIRIKLEEHLSGKKNWQHDLWSVLMFQSWINEN